MAGNQGNNRIVWEPWQIEFLKANYTTLTAQQLSNRLGITRTIVRSKKYALGLYQYKLEMWTHEQEQLIIDNYKTCGDKELAEMLAQRWKKEKGWTNKHVCKKRKYMNLKRTKEELLFIKEKAKQKGVYHIGNIGRWQKMGAAPVGTVRVWWHNGSRPLAVIKTNDGWVHYAPWLYKQQCGPVPDGYNVCFIDGDPTNVTIENLYLVSNAELAIMNSRNRNSIEVKRKRATWQLEHTINLINKINTEYEKQIERLK